jgi:hypothetical protein
MPARKRTIDDETAQIDRFKALAREPGCDGREAAFESASKARAASKPVRAHEPKKHQPK